MATQRDHDRALTKVRQLCTALPEVSERPSHGSPAFFIRGKYVGPSGWVGVRLDRDIDWDEVDAILHDAYRKVAPKALVKQLDADDG